MVDLSIIIISWNTRELLRECLESINLHTKGIIFEVFVVDNASADQSAAMVKESFPSVTLIENKDNVGFSKANNQAIRASKGRYVALLNPDTLLIEDVFTRLIQYADLHEETGAVGPKILCGDGQTIQYTCARKLPSLYFDFCKFSGLIRLFPKLKLFSGSNLRHWDHNTSRHVELLSGACMVVSRKTIEDVGLMDENQFLYVDEVDWCKRIIDKRWKIFYCSDSSIIHYGGESSKQAQVAANKEYLKAKWYYYVKHHGATYARVFCAQLGFLSLCKYIGRIVVSGKNPGRRKIMEINRAEIIWALQKIIGK